MRTIPFETEISRKSGEKALFSIERCEIEDLEQIIALQDSVHAAMSSGVFHKTSEEEIKESLTEDLCLKAVCKGELAGFTLLVRGRDSYRNYGNYLGYGSELLKRCVSFDTTFISPSYRGYGLQKLFFALREEFAISEGAEIGLTTISPDNTYSLRNANAMGFREEKRVVIYGGLTRVILKKSLK